MLISAGSRCLRGAPCDAPRLVRPFHHFRPIFLRSRHRPRASTDGSRTRNVNETGVRLWTIWCCRSGRIRTGQPKMEQDDNPKLRIRCASFSGDELKAWRNGDYSLVSGSTAAPLSRPPRIPENRRTDDGADRRRPAGRPGSLADFTETAPVYRSEAPRRSALAPSAGWTGAHRHVPSRRPTYLR